MFSPCATKWRRSGSRPSEVLLALVAQLVPGPIQHLRSDIEVLFLDGRHGGDGEDLLAALSTGVIGGELDIERAGLRLRVDRRFRDGELPVGAAGGEGGNDGEEGEVFEHHGVNSPDCWPGFGQKHGRTPR